MTYHEIDAGGVDLARAKTSGRRYELVTLLGAGAMGEVTAQLDHPAIVPVYGLEDDPNEAPAYAMKFVRGVTLSSSLEEAGEQAAGHGKQRRSHRAHDRSGRHEADPLRAGPYEDEPLRRALESAPSGRRAMSSDRLALWTRLGSTGMTYLVVGPEAAMLSATTPR